MLREAKQRLGGDAAGTLRRPVENEGGDAGELDPQRRSDGALNVGINAPPRGGRAGRLATALKLNEANMSDASSQYETTMEHLAGQLPEQDVSRAKAEFVVRMATRAREYRNVYGSRLNKGAIPEGQDLRSWVGRAI
jgi:hypothetical protein